MVAAPIPGVPMPVLIDHVEQLTRHCVGLAGIYVLDADSGEELARSFGGLHAVPFGALRTYLPGVDPASTVDTRRCRIMLARTIAAQPGGKLARTLGWASRTRSMNLPPMALPAALNSPVLATATTAAQGVTAVTPAVAAVARAVRASASSAPLAQPPRSTAP
jgi:hypothetical protein